MDGQMD